MTHALLKPRKPRKPRNQGNALTRTSRWLTGLVVAVAFALAGTSASADSLASNAASELQTCENCSNWRAAWDDPNDLGKHRLDNDVSVRGWRMMRGVYVGHTRSRLGRSGVGVMVDSGEIQYTLNHQGFTVSRKL